MTNKQHYINFCEKIDLPIFSQPYWLDAVCGIENWDVALVNNGNEILASLPYFIEKKKTFTMCWMPSLTQKLGPHIIYPSNQKSDSKLSYEKKIITELLSQLPQHDLFLQNFDNRFDYWSPLYWLGYEQTTRYTFVLNKIKNHQQIEENYSSDLRRAIRKAEKNLSIIEEDNIDEIYRLIELTFSKNNGKPKFSKSILESIHKTLKTQGKCKCFFAKTENGEKIAGAFIVWDTTTAYYLVGGANPKSMNLQPQSLLLDYAIKSLSKEVDVFDFEGSMVEDIEKFFRSFGAHPTPYFSITKNNNSKLKLLNFVRSKF